MQRELIICKTCGTTHGPTEAKHVVRFTCDHCGKEYDTENYTIPLTWTALKQLDTIRFVLCSGCTVEHEEWLHLRK